MKIKLHVPVKIDGVEFEAGTYDASDIPAGNLDSLLAAKWARKVSNSEADGDEDDESAAPKAKPRARNRG